VVEETIHQIVTGPAAVVALVILEWSAGWIAGAAWTQSWDVIRRGHFRISAWTIAGLTGIGVATYWSIRSALSSEGAVSGLVVAFACACVLYLLVQYSRTDVPGVVLGSAGAVVGAAALVMLAGQVEAWSLGLSAAAILSGAVVLGGVVNGMMLGHWYLNQPGLKPWALGKLTDATLIAVGVSLVIGVIAAPRLLETSIEGAGLGLFGGGSNIGTFLYAIWLVLLVFTGVIVWAARRCVAIRSIQSATGLFYVALLSGGVSEFLVRYLMVNAG
jgi:hypothetical protein